MNPPRSASGAPPQGGNPSGRAKPVRGVCLTHRLHAARLQSPASARGFTLVEVLVALAIVAIALGAGMRATGALADNAQRLADVSAAQWCAENQLTGLRLSKQFPNVGDSDAGCDELGRSYRVQLQTRPTFNPNFRRVDAVVSDDAGRQLLTLTAVLGRY